MATAIQSHSYGKRIIFGLLNKMSPAKCYNFHSVFQKWAVAGRHLGDECVLYTKQAKLRKIRTSGAFHSRDFWPKFWFIDFDKIRQNRGLDAPIKSQVFQLNATLKFNAKDTFIEWKSPWNTNKHLPKLISSAFKQKLRENSARLKNSEILTRPAFRKKFISPPIKKLDG